MKATGIGDCKISVTSGEKTHKNIRKEVVGGTKSRIRVKYGISPKGFHFPDHFLTSLPNPNSL